MEGLPRVKSKRALVATTLAAALAGIATTPMVAPAQEDVWAPFRPLAARWEGTSHGQPGDGKTERSCEFVLRGMFLECRNKTTYPPQAKNAKGEVHEDVGLVSYDKARKTFVLRQFHVEGFVNQYVLEGPPAAGRPLTFVTESIENIPPGWRASETWQITGDDWTETFGLASGGKPFEPYSESRLRRVK